MYEMFVNIDVFICIDFRYNFLRNLIDVLIFYLYFL